MSRRTGRPRVAVVIAAGGSGTRLGGPLPKQFLTIDGEPILATTVRLFANHPAVDRVVVAAPAAHLARTRRILRPLTSSGPARDRAGRLPGGTVAVVEGGGERQDSVWRALQAIPEAAEIVLVHDAVRPFATRALIDAILTAATETGAALCALPIADTVKRVTAGLVTETLDRRGLWAVQTPQGFRAALLREAHDKARREGVVGTDDAALVERLGQPVRVVAGLAANVKITTPEDLRRARGPSRPQPRAPRSRTQPRAPRSRTEPRAPRTGHPRFKPISQPPLQ